MHTSSDIDSHLSVNTAPADFHPTAHKELLSAVNTLAAKTITNFATLAAAQAAGAAGQLAVGQHVSVG